MKTVVHKISDDSFIDLASLSVEELDRLHFDEERYTAARVRQTSPCSIERSNLLQRGYGLINLIMQEKFRKQGQEKKTYGGNANYCTLVKDELREIRKRKKSIIFFEAGVGGGLVINSLRGEMDLIIKGCDFCISDDLAQDSQFDLQEGAIDSSLRNVEDASIDLFYWNDVLEHILDDEIDQYMQLIHRKMANRGIVITITPNRHVGPGDISRYFLPRGSKAEGFHFHEYSTNELNDLFSRHGFQTKRCVFMNPMTKAVWNGPKSRLGIRFVKNVRYGIEFFAPIIKPYVLKKAIIYMAGCIVSIEEKK